MTAKSASRHIGICSYEVASMYVVSSRVRYIRGVCSKTQRDHGPKFTLGRALVARRNLELTRLSSDVEQSSLGCCRCRRVHLGLKPHPHPLPTVLVLALAPQSTGIHRQLYGCSTIWRRHTPSNNRRPPDKRPPTTYQRESRPPYATIRPPNAQLTSDRMGTFARKIPRSLRFARSTVTDGGMVAVAVVIIDARTAEAMGKRGKG